MTESKVTVEKMSRAMLVMSSALALALTALAGALEQNDRYPSDVLQITLNTTQHLFGAQCLEAWFQERGDLVIEVSVPGSTSSQARLVLVEPSGEETSAGASRFAYLARTPSSLWLEIREAGSYWFCVDAADTERQLGEYKLRAVFRGRKEGEDPDEVEVDPEPRIVSGLKAVWWSRSLRRRLDALCSAGQTDDHGDVFACATALRLGQTVDGRIWSPWGGDDDVFVFAVNDFQTVEIKASGEADTFGALYDSHGQRLAVGEDGSGGESFRIVRTLGPGWYFVRVEGRHYSEGPYRLSVKAHR